MFCHKCGSELPNEARFCNKCGAKLIGKDLQQQAAVSTPVEPIQQLQQQPQAVTVNMPEKKKSGKLLIGLGVVGIVVIAAIIIALNWNGKMDYAGTVGAHMPFAASQGLLYTYEEVLNKYISSPEWEVRDSGDVHYVDISGTLKGMDSKLSITIQITLDPDDSDIAIMRPESVTLDGIKTSTEDEATRFLYNMFLAYDEGHDDLSWLQTEADEETEPADIDGALYAEYGETAKQILLDWFDRHPLMQNIHIQYMNDAVDAEDGSGKCLMYAMYMEGEEYGIFYVNPNNGDMTMDSVTDIQDNWSFILAPMEQWYLEYYWGLTDDSRCYTELYSDDLYILYDGDDIEILEYNAGNDSYVICNWDIICSVEYGDGSINSASGISAKDLIGEYGYDASFEADDRFVNFYYSLQIDWVDSGLVVTETWRGNYMFDHVWVSPDSLVGNTLTFSVDAIDGSGYETHTLTYVPEEDSPSGMDTIYIDGDEEMPFLRE